MLHGKPLTTSSSPLIAPPPPRRGRAAWPDAGGSRGLHEAWTRDEPPSAERALAHYRASLATARFSAVPTPADGDGYLWAVAAGALARPRPPALLASLARAHFRAWIGDAEALAALVDPARVPAPVRAHQQALHERFAIEVVGGLRAALAEHVRAHASTLAVEVFGSAHVRRVPDELAARAAAVIDWSDVDNAEVAALLAELEARAAPRFAPLPDGLVPLVIGESDAAALAARAAPSAPWLDRVSAAYAALLATPGTMISRAEARMLARLLDRQLVEIGEGDRTAVRTCVRADTTDGDPIVLFTDAVHARFALPFEAC